MTNARREIADAARQIADTLQRMPCNRNSLRWLRDQMLDMLLHSDNIDALAKEYSDEYAYADIENPFLVEVLKSYDLDLLD